MLLQTSYKFGMKKETYKISVITVVYNGVKTIERTIQSVLGQLYENIEYIIIDGQSTDGTQQIITKYIDSIAYFISEKDMGIYDAMNKGIKYVTGDYVIFINSDDRLTENFLDQCTRYLDDTVDILYGDIYMVQEDEKKEIKVKGELENVQDIIYRSICHQAVLAKTRLLKDHPFDMEYKIAADYDWLLKVFYKGANFVYAPVVFSHYCASGYSAINGEMCMKESFKISVKYLRKSCIKVQERYEPVVKKLYYRYLIEDICEKAEGRKIIRKVLKELIDPKEKIYMFGKGKNAAICLRVLNIIGVDTLKIFDNNIAIQGTVYQGIKVTGPDQAGDKNRKVVVSTIRCESEVHRQLLEDGFTQIILFSDIKDRICQAVRICCQV